MDTIRQLRSGPSIVPFTAKTEEIFDDPVEDRLSYCSCLHLILPYVNGNDVISCLRVNRRINSMVHRIIDKLPRVRAKVTIWNKLSASKSCHIGITLWNPKRGEYNRSTIWYAPFWDCDGNKNITKPQNVNDFTDRNLDLVQLFFRRHGHVSKLEFIMENRPIVQSCLELAKFLEVPCDFTVDTIEEAVASLELLDLSDVTIRVQESTWDPWDKTCIIDLLMNWVNGSNIKSDIKSLRLTTVGTEDDDDWITLFNGLYDLFQSNAHAVLVPQKNETGKRSFRLGRILLLGDEHETELPQFLEVSFYVLCSAVSIVACNPNHNCPDCGRLFYKCVCID